MCPKSFCGWRLFANVGGNARASCRVATHVPQRGHHAISSLAMAVQLRPLTIADWKAVHEWARREDVCRYQAWGPNTAQQTRSFVQAAVEAWSQRPQTRFVYAITLDFEVVGNAELRLHRDRQGEIAYVVHPGVWGRGIATQAARQLLIIGFSTHKLHRIFGTCDPRNRASGRVLAKIGMTYEGRMRETLLIRDGWRDSDLYAILETDCPVDGPKSAAEPSPEPLNRTSWS